MLTCLINLLQVDLQACDVAFESWGHTTDQLLFQWNKEDLTVNPSVEEGLNQHLALVEFIDLTNGTSFSTGNVYLMQNFEYCMPTAL